MTSIYDVFPKRLRTAMEARNVKAADFELNCCHTTTINKYLYQKHLPNTYILRDIAVFLNVSADYLLGLSDEMESKPAWVWKDGECVCSKCNGFGETTFRYCPNCGERMNVR